MLLEFYQVLLHVWFSLDVGGCGWEKWPISHLGGGLVSFALCIWFVLSCEHCFCILIDSIMFFYTRFHKLVVSSQAVKAGKAGKGAGSAEEDPNAGHFGISLGQV
jgi:hypothetical protein